MCSQKIIAFQKFNSKVILIALEVDIDLLQKNIYSDITSKGSKIKLVFVQDVTKENR